MASDELTIPNGPTGSDSHRTQTDQRPETLAFPYPMSRGSTFDPQCVLGDYQLLEPIGSGGMGNVFKARHVRMQRIVALKTMRGPVMDESLALPRFLREVQAAAQLFHPNIVTAFDAGEQDGIHYLVMEYVEGSPLSQFIRMQGPLAVRIALNYVYQTAKGLEYAHSRHFVHRDIKPSNLMLNQDDVIKILDMGLVRSLNSAPHDLTSSGAVLGTMEYAAPEQIRDSRQADHRSDIYSLGCTLYYLLSGKPVFEGNPIAIALAHTECPLPSLCVTRGDVPISVDAIFRRMAAKDPRQRFQATSELLIALERLGANSVSGSSVIGLTDTAFMGTASTATIRAGISAVAIDLDSATSRIAWIDGEGRPTTLKTSDGNEETRSTVIVHGSKILAGNKADEIRLDHPEHIIQNLMRHLGESRYPQPLDGKSYPPASLLALLLRGIADDTRKQIGHLEHVVLSVPSAYDELRRAAIQDAGYIAGLQVMDLINKPTAAITDWWVKRRLGGQTNLARPRLLLVYRIGVGSFDATVFRIDGPEIRALAVGGEVGLGRRQFEQRMVQRISDQFRAEHGVSLPEDACTSMRLARMAERALQKLSHSPHVATTFGHDERSIRAVFSSDFVETNCRDLIERTLQFSTQAVADAKLSWSEIDQILLVGTFARMPAIGHALVSIAKPNNGPVSIDEASIAHGASIHAACLLPNVNRFFQQLHVSDVSFHSLGVVGTSAITKERKNAVVIPRNSPLPAVGKRSFRAMPLAGQALSIPIVQGEDPNPDRCQLIGTCDLHDLPIDIPPGALLEVEFHVRSSGRLSVVVEVAATKERIAVEIRRPNPLTHEKLLRWREWLDTSVLCAGIE